MSVFIMALNRRRRVRAPGARRLFRFRNDADKPRAGASPISTRRRFCPPRTRCREQSRLSEVNGHANKNDIWLGCIHSPDATYRNRPRFPFTTRMPGLQNA